MAYVVVALLASFVVTLLAIRLNLGNPEAHRRYVVRRRAAWIRQPSLSGLSRAGGVGVAIGLLVSLTARMFDDAVAAPIAARMGLLLLLCALPVFVAGLVEDFYQGLAIGTMSLSSARRSRAEGKFATPTARANPSRRTAANPRSAASRSISGAGQ